mgnify:CR=1 FL=1
MPFGLTVVTIREPSLRATVFSRKLLTVNVATTVRTALVALRYMMLKFLRSIARFQDEKP